jgi:hypothetical protein
MIKGPDYSLDEPFENLAKSILSEYGTPEEIKTLPYEVIYRALTFSDQTKVITPEHPTIKLTDIVGPYTVCDEDKTFLCKVNLHSGYFGQSFPELDLIYKLKPLSFLYITYLDKNGLLREIQVLRK